MSRRFRRGVMVGLAVACGTVMGPVAVAGASDATLRKTVRKDLPNITRSQARILDGIAAYQQSHSVSSLLSAIAAQDGNLSALKAALSHESASSAKGRTGKRDLITGLSLIIGSNRTLAKSLKKQAAGKHVSTSRLKAAVAADQKGNLDLNAGTKLLKV